jgi:predicted RNase H-like HicB family nuclease
MRAYTVILTPDQEEGGYTVTVPALPGCFTQGDTEEEALANAREAIRCHVEGLRIDGEPVPEADVVPKVAVVIV